MTKETRVGFLIVFAGIVLVLAIFLIGDQEGAWKRKYELKILYDDVAGLLPGAPVHLLGLRVGSVSHIEFSDTLPGKLEVVVKVNRSVRERIRRDSEAKIATMGLLGDKTIEITGGSVDSAVLEDGEYLPSGSTASIEAIISSGADVVDNIRYASADIRQIIEKINNGTGSLGLFVNDPNVYFDLDRLLILTENLTKQLESGQGSFARFVRDSTFYIETQDLLVNTNQLFDSLNAGKGTLAQLIKDPAPYQDLKQIVSSWKEITERINSGEGTAGQLLTNDSLYINLSRTLERTEALLQDIRENPGRYIRFRLF